MRVPIYYYHTIFPPAIIFLDKNSIESHQLGVNAHPAATSEASDYCAAKAHEAHKPLEKAQAFGEATPEAPETPAAPTPGDEANPGAAAGAAAGAGQLICLHSSGHCPPLIVKVFSGCQDSGTDMLPFLRSSPGSSPRVKKPGGVGTGVIGGDGVTRK